MTGPDMNDRDILDFPGARRLKAAGKVAPPSADAVAAALAAVRSAAAADRAAGGGQPIELEREPMAVVVPIRPWRRRLPVLVSAAAVAAIALGVAFQPWSGSGDTQGSPAAAPTAERTGTAPYWKVRMAHWSRSSGKEQRDQSYETVWLGRDGTRGQFGNGPVRDYTEGPLAGTAFWTGRNPIMWRELGDLPTEPAALRSRLVGKATGEEVPEALYDGIEELLAKSPAEPRLRAALFKVLTEIPGTRVTERVKDSTGRTGTAVDLEAETWHKRLVIDTGTFHTLESVTTARDDGLKWGPQTLRAGDLLLRTTYLSVGPAWETPEIAPRT